MCTVDTVEKEVDDAKLLAVLHSLYSITFTPPGRDAVVTVLALDDNIAVLLPFIQMNGASAGQFYVFFLVLTFFSFSSKIS